MVAVKKQVGSFAITPTQLPLQRPHRQSSLQVLCRGRCPDIAISQTTAWKVVEGELIIMPDLTVETCAPC